MTDVRCVRGSLSFEDAQAFVRRAFLQLSVADQSEDESRERLAIVLEEMIRMSYEKSVAYKYPLDEVLKKEFEFVQMSQKKLAELEFQLSLTPTQLAARYIAWVHDSLGTDAPNPLAGWLKEMYAEIQRRHSLYISHRLLAGAQRQVFALVGMYASALSSWLEEFGDALSLDVAATSFTIAGLRMIPELSARIIEQKRSLRICGAALKIIEDDHIGQPVLPSAMRSALDSHQFRFGAAFASPVRSAPASEETELAAEAQTRVKTWFATACATANKFHCHQQLLSLAEANLNLGKRRDDYLLAMHCIEQARAKTGATKKIQDRINHRSANKPGKPVGMATSATRLTRIKPAH